MKYVIIGNSTAGINAVQGIRQIDSEGEITIISEEPWHTYSRPLISYLLQGKTDDRKIKYRSDDFYDKHQCKILLNTKVQQIKGKEKQVVLDDGTILPYDKLLVAVGSSPFVPPTEGLDTVSNWFTFMSLNDAKRLQQVITPQSRVLIVGAGLIGLKCAEGIHQKVAGITVVDLAPRILSSILDDEGAARVQQHLERTGIRFLLSCSVQRFDGNKALLSNGSLMEFDVLVMAVGVRPNTDLIRTIGGKVNRGIITDNYLETSIPDVYAAGDCTESMDISCDMSRVLALLPNAAMQGECAGINMAGGKKTFTKAIAMNAIGFMGLHMITAGSYTSEAFTDSCSGSYKKLFVQDGLLKGYIMIGNVDKAGIYTSLIREKTPLDTVDFELIRKRPGLMAFSTEDRRVKLGGAVR